MPGPTFGFVKLLASSGSHCTKWADEQHRQAGFESRLVPDLPLPFIPTLIGLRAFDLVSSRIWWEAATNIGLIVTFMFFKFSGSLIGPNNLSIYFLSILFCVLLKEWILWIGVFWSSAWNWIIRLQLKSPDIFLSHFLGQT